VATLSKLDRSVQGLPGFVLSARGRHHTRQNSVRPSLVVDESVPLKLSRRVVDGGLDGRGRILFELELGKRQPEPGYP
jgi:hypothetical protein